MDVIDRDINQGIKDENDNEQNETTAETTKQKPKSSKRKADKKRIWSEDQVAHLINIWSSEEVLYNVKHKLYFNKQERQKCLERVRLSLLDNLEIEVTEKDISDKMTALRTYSGYYGAERRKG